MKKLLLHRATGSTLEEPVKVYNFEVEDWHTYHVASLNEDLVTPKALVFLEKCNDEYLRALEEVGIYGNDSSTTKLEELYFDFLKL